MRKLFIIYTCDANHMNSTKIAIGYYNDFDAARGAILLHSLKSSEGILSEDDLFNLRTIKQTQNRSENYIIEEVPLNTLL